MAHAQPALVNYQTVRLARGSHRSPDRGACVTELASMLAGEPFSDHPTCASPVVAAILRRVNDRVGPRRRQELRYYAAAVVDSRGSVELERMRAAHCVAWVREHGSRRWWQRVALHQAERNPRDACVRLLEPFIARARRGDLRGILGLVDELLAMDYSDTSITAARTPAPKIANAR